jgi:lipid-binding SYLF domain-containing protein
MEMTKGSVGLQAGISSTDLVLVVMNESGADKLLRNKVTLGTDASIAAGPVGRTASAATDAQLSAEMLSYSRSKGLFAGIDLSGGSLNPDASEERACVRNERVGARHRSGTTRVKVTPEMQAFTNALGRESVRRRARSKQHFAHEMLSTGRAVTRASALLPFNRRENAAT